MQSKYFRLDRFISKKKSIKRKDIRLLLAQKRIRVNGMIAENTQQIIGPFCEITLDDEVIQSCTPIYLMMNKPVGVVSANVDHQHKTVFDLIDQTSYSNLHIAGRLDLNTSGLILLTNDGKWSKAISSPNYDIKKHYIVTLRNDLTEEYIPAFAKGMHFPYEDIITKPAQLEVINKKTAHVWLTEGKYHQIKRMFGRFRNEVLQLHRQSIGEIELKEDLAPGEHRELNLDEITSIDKSILKR